MFGEIWALSAILDLTEVDF